jgi:hypothetical protein
MAAEEEEEAMLLLRQEHLLLAPAAQAVGAQVEAEVLTQEQQVLQIQAVVVAQLAILVVLHTSVEQVVLV